MNIWFTGDTHFYHRKIIKNCHRPFNDELEMNAEIEDQWKKTVGPKDLIFHLGDVSYGPHSKKSIETIRSLPGRKILIVGNHDKHLRGQFERVFEKVKDYEEFTHQIKGGKVLFCLFHYPIEFWNKWHWSAVHIHGHSHGIAPKKTNRFDVGVDVTKFVPIHIDDIMKRWEINEPYKKVDSET